MMRCEPICLSGSGRQYRRAVAAAAQADGSFIPQRSPDLRGADAARWRTSRRKMAEFAKQGTEVEIAEEMTYVTASIILKAMFSTETIDSIHQMKDAVETM